MQAVDRAELLASLASIVGPEPAVAAAVRVLGPADVAAALPFLQPLGLSAATRRAASKTLLQGAASQCRGDDRPTARRRSNGSFGSDPGPS